MGDDKQKVKFETKTTVDDAVSKLEELLQGLRQRQVLVRGRHESLRLHPGAVVSLSYEGRQKGAKESIEIEISWRTDAGLAEIEDLAIGLTEIDSDSEEHEHRDQPG